MATQQPGDRLTQLQDCLDQLATQMYACLRYVNTHHAPTPVPGQQFERHFPQMRHTLSSSTTNNNANHTNPTTAVNGNTTRPSTPAPAPAPAPDADDAAPDPSLPRPDSPTTFASALRELSRDLVLKEQQIEFIIRNLPGIGEGREEQEERLREAEEELKRVEEEAEEWVGVKEGLVKRVEGVLRGVWRP